MSNRESEELWDDYSSKFNSLSGKMQEAGLDSNELIELLKAYENLPDSFKNVSAG